MIKPNQFFNEGKAHKALWSALKRLKASWSALKIPDQP